MLSQLKYTMKTYWCNANVSFSKNIEDDTFNLKQNALCFNNKSWTVEKAVTQCFDIKATNIYIRLSVSEKQSLNLCSFKWPRKTRRWVTKVPPFGWLTLKTSLLRGAIKFEMFFLKFEHEGELQISKYNSFHPTDADGKKSYSFL